MDGVRVVDTLPVLESAQYGDFPEIPEGSVLVLASTPWQKTEVEMMAAVVIQVCMISGEWGPVSAVTMFDELRRHISVLPVPHAYSIGLPMLLERGDLEIIEFEEQQYAVPMPSLVSKALGSGAQVRYASLRSEQPTEPIAFTLPRRGLISMVRRVIGR